MLIRIINEVLILIASLIASIIVIVTGVGRVIFNTPHYFLHIIVENYLEIRRKVLNIK